MVCVHTLLCSAAEATIGNIEMEASFQRPLSSTTRTPEFEGSSSATNWYLYESGESNKSSLQSVR